MLTTLAGGVVQAQAHNLAAPAVADSLAVAVAVVLRVAMETMATDRPEAADATGQAHARQTPLVLLATMMVAVAAAAAAAALTALVELAVGPAPKAPGSLEAAMVHLAAMLVQQQVGVAVAVLQMAPRVVPISV